MKLNKTKSLGFALLTLAILAAPLALVAQQGLPVKSVFAEQFNNWSFASQAANTYTFAGTNCQSYPLADGTIPSYFVFGNPVTPTYFPVFIQDAAPANSEIVTPTSLSTVAGACGFSAATVNQHTSFRVSSGTAGLQDAIAVLYQSATSTLPPIPVYLDRTWYNLVSGLPAGTTAQSIIAALKGGPAVYIVDTTTTPNTNYSWNGTAYSASASNVTVPTVAASTGAGTSPTITVVGTGTAGKVTLTTGTTPAASGAIFTLTWPSIAAGGFQYAPHCTITSLGTRPYTGTNAAVAGPPAVDTYTATATALTASVSGYQWSYSCY